ncbi:thiol reductant ABC exporter subunit CydC [Halopseudomonas pelagia]|uniref:Thiol reductant ABC exporter subunit CydC n=1 Tax=Halopseudomonas pelagia TaxID=553151 RepID=A0AA91Z5P3_9GAMM|nr:thiol reductant ABC exporter subunit CydC [Halopseudomonas pelagia]PCC99093.1 thiol reductant ABC exporter subunit CydC [Halopseudomonas pelagia]QFY58471.1 thiol reductant ABC exporter subunit CydC [Halopseudomonas pelagia]
MSELKPWLNLIMQRRARLWIGALLLALTLFSAVGLLALSGWFITATGVTALLWAAGQRVMFDVYMPGGGIRFFALTRTVARYFERVFNHNTVLSLLADLRGKHFAALAALDGATLGRLRAAQWLNRLTADIDTLDTLYLRLLAPPLVALLGVVLVCGLIAIFHASLALLIGALLLALLLALTLGMARLGLHYSARRVEQLDGLRVLAVEQLQGLAELTAAGTLGSHRQQLLSASQRMLDDQLVLQGRIAFGQALTTLGVMGAVVVGLFGTIQAYIAGLVSGPVMVMIPLALMALSEGFAGLPAAFAQYGGTRAAARRLNQQAAMSTALLDPAQPAALPADLTLHWRDVCVKYAGLQQLDLTLAAGKRLAIIGPSGSGKSTLAALAARLIDPDAGQLMLAATPLKQLSLSEWRAQIGYLTQHTELLHDSIAANLLLANPAATNQQLWQVLEMVDLAELVSALPAGINTWVGESGKQLSGGEGRRLALARVLLKDAPLVILDEPFSGLDAVTRERVSQRLEPWLEGRTALFLGHDAALLPKADRVIALDSL